MRQVRLDDTEPKVFAEALRDLAAGMVDTVGEVTLEANQATTTTENWHAQADENRKKCVVLEPITANAAAEKASGTMYVSAIGDKEFTITHTNNAQTDRTFRFAILG